MTRTSSDARKATRRTPAARLVLAGIATAIVAAATPAPAASFVDGKSKGMTKCVRAMLGGYKIKKVNVHGHHFHCHPLYSGSGGERTIRLTHSQFGKDDEVFYYFTVNSLNVIQADTLRRRVIRGIALKNIGKMLPPYKFKGPPGAPIPQNYDDFARYAHAIRPVKVRGWRTVAKQISSVVIAELGNPDNRGFAGGKAGRVNCYLPVFYEHDNFAGRGYIARQTQSNLHKVKVSGKHMGDLFSSMCVPRGWEVTVYENPGFKGKSFRFSGPQSVEDLKRQKVSGKQMNWGDKISSVRVRRR